MGSTIPPGWPIGCVPGWKIWASARGAAKSEAAAKTRAKRRTICEDTLSARREQILVPLARADHVHLAALDEHLGRERPQVVAARHRRAVRAGAAEQQEVAARDRRQRAIDREEVAGLAHGAD